MFSNLIERIWKQKRSVAPGSTSSSERAERSNAGLRLGSLVDPAREVSALAWPIAVALLGDTAMGLVDTKLVASLGAAAIGGVGVATTVMYVGVAFALGILRGVKVRASHAHGEGKTHHASSYALAGMILGATLGALIFAITRDFSAGFRFMRIDPTSIPYATEFLAARTFGAAGFLMMNALVQYRQGLGDSRTPMVVGIAGNLVNAGLAYSLIHGRFGMPALGVRGAGYGTAITEVLEFVALAALYHREAIEAARRGWSSLKRSVGEVLTIGLPSGTQFAAELLAFTTFTAILGSIGANQIAAHQIAMAVVRTSFLPGLAIAEASSVLVGRSLGRRMIHEADKLMFAAMGLAMAFMTACGIVFAVAGRYIAECFSTDVAVTSVVIKLLMVAAVFQTLDAATMVLRSALRGAKDVRVVMIVGVTIAWTCIPTAAWILGRGLGMGALGGWFGFIAETTLAASILFVRWNRGGWRAQYQRANDRESDVILASEE
ncbi:MAG: MATE family efflux transporter, partial [Polyangiales bacterium]